MDNKFSKLRGKIAHITGDFAVNILASLIYTFARQIVVFPLLAYRMTDADYGELLTIIGLVNVCTALVGGTLNNVRLMQNQKYEADRLQGDFMPLCAFGSVCSVVFCGILSAVFSCSPVTALLLSLYVVVENFYLYATAFFRLNLDFKRNLVANVVVSIAYIPGALLFATAELWPAVFLLGEGVGLIYTAKTTHFHREPFARTPLLFQTGKTMFLLITVSLLGNLLNYSDRIIIYPLLGSESVSYYSTAAFFGKSASVVMGPIANVLLGYFSQKGFQPSKKLFTLVNGVSAGCLAVFMLGCWIFAPWFTKLLYPTLYLQAQPYIMLANFGAVVHIAGNMAQPMILKCCSTKWLVLVQALYGLTYVVSAVVLLPTYQLWGFCAATIIANGVRLLSLYILGYTKL